MQITAAVLDATGSENPYAASEPLTLAVTGPTGDIGRAFLRACDRSRVIGRVLGMARRRFDPG